MVPLLQGGGTPLKFIEALAYGLPVIATARAATGCEVRDGEDCLIADDEEAFAAALVRVLRDGAPELGLRGREIAARALLDRGAEQALVLLVGSRRCRVRVR